MTVIARGTETRFPIGARERRLLTLIFGLFALLASGHPAAAQTAGADDSAALWQYRETFPSAGGPVVPGGGVGGSGGGAGPDAILPSEIQGRLERSGGADAGVLEEIATSAALGAPPVRRQEQGSETSPAYGGPGGAAAGAPRRESADPAHDPSPLSGFSSAVQALGDEGDGELPVLFVVLAITTAAALGAAALRRRRGPGEPAGPTA